MDVREKLMELIGSTEYGNGSLVGNNFQKGFIEKIATHLIANGVTVHENVKMSDELLKQLKNAPITICKEEPSIELVQEWISVDERLPDDNDRVIAFRPNESETSAYKYCVMWGWSVKVSLKQHRGITHWMPLPPAPEDMK